MIFEGGAGWFKRKNYLQTAQEWNKSNIELIVLYVPPKNISNLWLQWIRFGKQILPKQNNQVVHLHHLSLFYKVNWTAPKYDVML